MGEGGYDTLDFSTATVGFVDQNTRGNTERIIGGSGDDGLYYYEYAEGRGWTR